MVLLEVLKADLKVQFTCASDDVLATLLDDALWGERGEKQRSTLLQCIQTHHGALPPRHTK